MGGVTSAGLPYPTTQDDWCDTDRYIRELAQAVDYRVRNAAFAFWAGDMNTNGSGDATVSFPTLAAVAGAIAFQRENGIAAVQSITGVAVTFRWSWNQQGWTSLDIRTMNNTAVTSSALAWGTPK